MNIQVNKLLTTSVIKQVLGIKSMNIQSVEGLLPEPTLVVGGTKFWRADDVFAILGFDNVNSADLCTLEEMQEYTVNLRNRLRTEGASLPPKLSRAVFSASKKWMIDISKQSGLPLTITVCGHALYNKNAAKVYFEREIEAEEARRLGDETDNAGVNEFQFRDDTVEMLEELRKLFVENAPLDTPFDAIDALIKLVEETKGE